MNRSEPNLLELADAGHYIALRLGFAYPLEEVNALPQAWVAHYSKLRLMLHDPLMHWVYGNTGVIRWSALPGPDPLQVLHQAQTFGLRYGISVSVEDKSGGGQRSFGHFARSDREFLADEMQICLAFVQQLHDEKAAPSNLTQAEVEALRMVKDGLRLKQIAFDLGVSEGAVKQRLKNAKAKLGARTSAQAAAMAVDYGLL